MTSTDLDEILELRSLLEVAALLRLAGALPHAELTRHLRHARAAWIESSR